MTKLKQAKPAKAKSAKRKPAVSKRVKPAVGLDGYVVIWRHTMDDVPVGLYATEAAARKAATTMTEKQAALAARRLGISCSTPVCFGYAVFKHGMAMDLIIVTRKDDA